jgi:hypothetical protein
MVREQSAVYEPEELSLLGGIFDRVVASLPAAMRTPVNRAEIARNILTCAAAGERNPSELELTALMIGRPSDLVRAAHHDLERVIWPSLVLAKPHPFLAKARLRAAP